MVYGDVREVKLAAAACGSASVYGTPDAQCPLLELLTDPNSCIEGIMTISSTCSRRRNLAGVSARGAVTESVVGGHQIRNTSKSATRSKSKEFQ